jgi:hypothetical protein
MSVGERDEAIELVIAVWAAPNDMQIEIDFGGRYGH